MSNWSDFVDKISKFKKELGGTGMSAPSIIRLIYSGAFDEMIDEELKAKPLQVRYKDITDQALSAMKSTAKLPKATTKELVGINKIDGIGNLMLWRFSTNPFARYDVSDFCKGFLKSQGFERPIIPEGDITWMKPAKNGNKTRIDIRYSWSDLFNKTRVLEAYPKDRLLASMCIVVKAEKRNYQVDKESLVVTLFNGHEYIEGVRMWPGESGKLNPLIVTQIKPYNLGLAIIRPKPWNDRPGGTLVSWTGVGS